MMVFIEKNHTITYHNIDKLPTRIDITFSSYCKNKHFLTHNWPLVTLDHITVIFENVPYLHSQLIPIYQPCWTMSLEVVVKISIIRQFLPLSDLEWPCIIWWFLYKKISLFTYHNIDKLPTRIDITFSSYCKNKHFLTHNWPLVTLDHITVIFENVPYLHSQLIPIYQPCWTMSLEVIVKISIIRQFFAPKWPWMTLHNMMVFILKNPLHEVHSVLNFWFCTMYTHEIIAQKVSKSTFGPP